MENKKKEVRVFQIFNKKRSKQCKKILMRKGFLSIALFIVASVAFFVSFFIQPKNLGYMEKSNLDYKVYLKENNYYEEKYLEKDMQYIANLIDYIDVDFKYEFEINENINYEYKYYVEADVIVFEKNNQKNIIYEKSEKILDGVAKSEQNSNKLNITENIKVDYSKYNDLIKGFKSDYAISADSHVKLKLYVDINGKQDKTEQLVKVNSNMEIAIPLTEQMINISTNYKDVNDNTKAEQSEKSSINKISETIGILFSGLFILAFINMISFALRSDGEKTYYQKKVEKILRDYDRVVVKLKKSINISENEEIIEVVSFEELLDLSDRLSKSILFMETDEKEKGWFIVKNGKEIYRYIIEENSLTVENKQWINI